MFTVAEKIVPYNGATFHIQTRWHSLLNKLKTKTKLMKKKDIPLIIIFVSFILILANIIMSEKIDTGFWLRIISSVFLILAMFLTIRERKKQSKKNSE
jgi:O-antigen/teichoic acid export membrane protein